MYGEIFQHDLGVPMGATAILVEVVCDPPNGTAIIRGFAPVQSAAAVDINGSKDKVVLPFACGLVEVELLSAKRIRLRRLAVQYAAS